MACGKLSNEWFTRNHPWPVVHIFLMKMVYWESPMACGKLFSNENGLLGITHGRW